ncbi:DUF559 domain-containing protein [Actinoplanes awajinensis]|uniref:DUF559 domain-containing protein n=1 Tax=Actinoplanes awajinensis subsp. mycoplanecinus TaxID=135947 RepID=A0A117MNU6_9ACTN|nr:DUF559 domain-containing protein [Actinoplanes awajinensis]KUL27669.1 hypothetical protein ADL15_34525 [Actinoplanes awajinensis subsp. mycoplanecinus]
MSRVAQVPTSLTKAPFRGSAAIRDGTLSRKMLRSRAWQRLLPDVYAHRDLPVDHRLRCTAVGLVMPAGTAIGGASAAHLWGAPLVHPDPPVSVVAPRDRWMNRFPRVAVHHTVLGLDDLTELDGTPVTTPERTAFDVGRRLPRVHAVVLFDALLQQGTLDAGAVMELARLRGRWPGIPLLKTVLSLADGRAESPMESRLRLLLHDGGLPAPQPQYEIRDSLGRLIARVDLGWPAARVAVEYEGDHHREREQFRRDISRAQAIQRQGWTILRFTANDVLRLPRETVLAVATELAKHR